MISHSQNDSAARERAWLPLGAFVFVLGALVALMVAPAVLLQRVSRLADELTTTVLPAYDAVRDLAFAMEHRISSSRSRFLTGDPLYEARLEEARAAERAALESVAAVAPRLGPAAVGHVEALRGHMARRDSLESALLAAGEPVEAYRAAVPRFEMLRDSMLVQLDGLRQELARITEARAAAEARWAARQRQIAAVLGVAALLAALLVGWFAWSQRRLRHQIQRALAEATRQRELAERRGEELQRATESRVRLLRGITHDVKNPLGAARGYAELLELEIKAPLHPAQRPLVEGIQRSVDAALAILADLLDLARADSGGLAIRPAPVELGALAAAAAAAHRPAAEAAGHTLEVRRNAEPLRLCTDAARVEQVLGNLLSNAVKYTPPPGRITVEYGLDDGAAGGAPCAVVRVSDTGPGIPPEQREAIFDEFTRLREGGAQPGHGLGLAIARRIARLLGGELVVGDAQGGGARFELRLPLPSEPEAGR